MLKMVLMHLRRLLGLSKTLDGAMLPVRKMVLDLESAERNHKESAAYHLQLADKHNALRKAEWEKASKARSVISKLEDSGLLD